MRRLQFFELGEQAKFKEQLHPDTLVVACRAAMTYQAEAGLSEHTYAVFEINELGDLFSLSYFDFEMLPEVKEQVKNQSRVQAAKQFYYGNEDRDPQVILSSLNVQFTTYTYRQWQDRNAQA